MQSFCIPNKIVVSNQVKSNNVFVNHVYNNSYWKKIDSKKTDESNPPLGFVLMSSNIPVKKVWVSGGRNNSISILEAFDLVSDLTGKPMKYSYSKNHRVGDHICYITDLSSIKSTLKGWDITKNLDEIFIEIISAWKKRFRKN